MSTYEIAVEYKDKHLTRPELHKIIGAALTNRADVMEVIIRCRSAAHTTYRAVAEIAAEGSIRNSHGKVVKVILAVDHRKGTA